MGIVFAIFGGFLFWYPIFTGLEFNKKLGAAHFWVTFIGVNITFFPQHFLGLAGMPRRYSDYSDVYYAWNFVRRLGRIITAVATLIFLYGIMYRFLRPQVVMGHRYVNTGMEFKRALYPNSFHTHTMGAKVMTQAVTSTRTR